MPYDPEGRAIAAAPQSDVLDLIFRHARTPNAWRSNPVAPALLEEAYALARMAPTSANSCPLRICFITGDVARAQLLPLLAPGNRAKTAQAPCTAIFAVDPEFYRQAPTLFPERAELIERMFATDPALAAETAATNGALQAGYFMLAARAVGLDCGPMAGFDRAAVDEVFLAGLGWRSILLCNLGLGSEEHLFPRNPRLAFDQACILV